MEPSLGRKHQTSALARSRAALPTGISGFQSHLSAQEVPSVSSAHISPAPHVPAGKGACSGRHVETAWRVPLWHVPVPSLEPCLSPCLGSQLVRGRPCCSQACAVGPPLAALAAAIFFLVAFAPIII